MSILDLIRNMKDPRDFEIYIPDSSTKTLEEILKKPIDVIYIVRNQTERSERPK